jgi:hypothetical protein
VPWPYTYGCFLTLVLPGPVYSGDLSEILTRAGEQDRLFTKEDITLPGSEVILLEPTKH